MSQRRKVELGRGKRARLVTESLSERRVDNMREVLRRQRQLWRKSAQGIDDWLPGGLETKGSIYLLGLRRRRRKFGEYLRIIGSGRGRLGCRIRQRL